MANSYTQIYNHTPQRAEMKPLLLIFFVAISLAAPNPAHSQPHPPVYLALVSHNEDNIQWLTRSYYIQRRNLLVQIANVVQSRGAVWDFQSDCSRQQRDG